ASWNTCLCGFASRVRLGTKRVFPCSSFGRCDSAYSAVLAEGWLVSSAPGMRACATRNAHPSAGLLDGGCRKPNGGGGPPYAHKLTRKRCPARAGRLKAVPGGTRSNG